MTKMDQTLRFEGAKANKSLKKRQLGPYNFLVYIMDQVHNLKIHRIIDVYGYPSVRTIGRDGMSAFWLLVQHQDFDLELQKECLAKCDFSKTDAAYLTDRVLVNQGKDQVYGTQFTGALDRKGNPIPRPIKNMKGLDKRRKEVGLA